ncbi:uncharacterized protein C20orf202 homolog [Petromyzon marinus]|uniref:uncharacterized protein C20orf202 homolog n=1 Tax=Petromyzon marinus TaxID=7757 RepID=UPI003F72C796
MEALSAEIMQDRSGQYGGCPPCSPATFSQRRVGRMDIGKALTHLRNELVELRLQDKALLQQLRELHLGLQELRLGEDNGSESGGSQSDISYASSFGDGEPIPWPGFPRARSRRNSMP